MWMTSCTGSSGLVAGGTHVCGGGGRCKSQNRKNVYLSPYVEEPLNSKKVIKSFVPELRSRKSFSCFGIPMFYVYILWTFYVRLAYPYHGYDTPLHNTIQFWRTVEEFQILLINTNNSFQHYPFVCTQFNCSKYCYASLTIQLNIHHLFAHSLNAQTVLFNP